VEYDGGDGDPADQNQCAVDHLACRSVMLKNIGPPGRLT